MADGQVGLDAEVVSKLPLSRFLVELGDGTRLTAVLSRGDVGYRNRPGVEVGDRVRVELSPYDPAKCRIVESGRAAEPPAAPDRPGGPTGAA